MSRIRYRKTPKEAILRKRQSDLDATDLIELIHGQTGINFMTIRTVVDRLFRTIQDEMKQGRTIDIRNFGTFHFHPVREWIRPDISNGNRKSLTPAHTVIRFTPDGKWNTWQKMNSMQFPDQLPEGVVYSTRIQLSQEGRRLAGITTPREDLVSNKDTLSFFDNIVVPRAKSIAEKQNKETDN